MLVSRLMVAALGACLLAAASGCGDAAGGAGGGAGGAGGGAESEPAAEPETPVPVPRGDPSRRPHLILISLDTLRADHLSCYGYARETSPVLDALAAESWLFEQVVAPSSSTAPSHTSLFTGVLPRVHEVLNERPAQPSPGLAYLPELLTEAGWRTAAFADGGILTEAYGFDRGFELFESRYEPWSVKLERVLAWLDAAPREPTFLFVHTYGVHAPYLPEDGHDLFSDPRQHGTLRKLADFLRERRDAGELTDLGQVRERFWNAVLHEELSELDAAYLRDLYDGCIHGVDAGLGRLLDALRADGWLDDAWLVVTSDHGEAFGEHGDYGHRTLYREELHVPLLVRPPGGAPGARIAPRVSQLDLPPTLLELLGLPAPAQMQGASLWPFDALAADRRAYATDGAFKRDAVLDGPLKLIQRAQQPLELYAVDADPHERRDLAELPERRATRDALLTLLRGMRRAAGALQRELGGPIVDPGELDPERAAELRALGYLK